MQYEKTKHRKFNRLHIKGESTKEKIPVKTKKNTSSLTYKEAKRIHKQAIREQRKAIWQSHVAVWRTIFAEAKERRKAHKTIRQHKLLTKQARTLHKLNTI